MAALQHIYNIQNKRFIADGTERTCIYACAARNALVIIYASLLVLAHIDSLDLAGGFAGALIVMNGTVGADLGAGTALLTLCLVDMCDMIFIKRDCTETAYILTTVSKATAAGICNLVAAHRTFVTGDINNLYNIRIFLISAHGKFYALIYYRSFLIDAATHGRNLAGHDCHRDIKQIILQGICPCLLCYLAQDFILKVLYFCIKFSHK